MAALFVNGNQCQCCVGQKWSMLCQSTAPDPNLRNSETATWDLVDTHTHAHQIESNESSGGRSDDGLFAADDKSSLAAAAVLAVSEAEWDTVLRFTGHLEDKRKKNEENEGNKEETRVQAGESKKIQFASDVAKGDKQVKEGSSPVFTSTSRDDDDGASSSSTGLVTSIADHHKAAARASPARPLLVPGLGVHPWYVHEAEHGWQRRLRALLLAHPSAIVGEVGLCKCAKNLRGPGNKEKHWHMQRSFLKTQLALACELGRPASVHCVNAMGPLLQVLKELQAGINNNDGDRNIDRNSDRNRNDSNTAQARESAPRDAASKTTPVAETAKENTLEEHQFDHTLSPSSSSSSSSSSLAEPKHRRDGAPGEEEASPLVGSHCFLGWDRAQGLPPKIALHSFSGTALQVKELLALEGGVRDGNNVEGEEVLGGGEISAASSSKRAAKRAAKRATKVASRLEKHHQSVNYDYQFKKYAAASTASARTASSAAASNDDTSPTAVSEDVAAASAAPTVRVGDNASKTLSRCLGPSSKPTPRQQGKATQFYFGFSHTVNVRMGFGAKKTRISTADVLAAEAAVATVATAQEDLSLKVAETAAPTPPLQEPLMVPAKAKAACAAELSTTTTTNRKTMAEAGAVAVGLPIKYEVRAAGNTASPVNAAAAAAAAASALRKKAVLVEAIRAVPDHRLLLESDEVGYHTDGALKASGETSSCGGERHAPPAAPQPSSAPCLRHCTAAMVRAVALVAEAKGWSLINTASITAANGRQFLLGGVTNGVAVS